MAPTDILERDNAGAVRETVELGGHRCGLIAGRRAGGPKLTCALGTSVTPSAATTVTIAEPARGTSPTLHSSMRQRQFDSRLPAIAAVRRRASDDAIGPSARARM
jgi:hypothetical protein